MHEYIERGMVIEKSQEYYLGGSYDNTERAVPVDYINSLPAAEVRPVVRGEWESTGGGTWRCSQCGYGVMPWNAGQNFCPHCGADMREDHDG